MSCRKYTLVNTGDTTINFSYQRCNDALWQYQVELFAGQTKNIWLIDDTFTISNFYTTSIQVVDDGAFPPIDPTPTPTPVTQTPTPSNSPTPSITPTNTETPTNTPTPTSTQTPTVTTTTTPTPTPTAFRNMFFSNSNTGGAEITGFTASFTSSLNFSFPVTVGMNAQAFHGPITNGVDTIEVYVTGGTNVSVAISKNGGQIIQNYGTSPYTFTFTFNTNLTEDDQLAIYLYDGAVTNSLGYDVASSATACTNFISSPSTYYSSLALATSVNIFTNASLTTLAPDGYYSDGTNYYQVSSGSNLGPVSC